jgi:hypothetical protein
MLRRALPAEKHQCNVGLIIGATSCVPRNVWTTMAELRRGTRCDFSVRKSIAFCEVDKTPKARQRRALRADLKIGGQI